MTTKLMDTFDFTPDDLAYNRRAEYSPRQKAKLAKEIRKNKRSLFIITLVTFSITVYLALPFIQAMSLEGDIIRLIGTLGMLGLSALFFSGLFDRTKFEITHVEGRVQFISRDSTTHTEDSTYTDTSFYIVVGERKFLVDPSQYDAFTQGHIYRVYIGQTLMLSTGLISIEYIGPAS